jgi:hypothetical protein
MSKILKIRLDTAIPPSGRMVDFTRSMLTKPTSKDAKGTQTVDRPSVTLGPDVFYSDDYYYPTNLSHDKMMEFLFNQKKFDEIIKKQVRADKTKRQELEKVQKHNIMITLKCLFPVGYPVINDIDDSHSLLNDGSAANTLMFYPFRDYKSYLTIGPDVYTVQRVVWIDDEYNYDLELDKDKVPPPPHPRRLKTQDVKNFVKVDNQIYVMLDLIKGEVNKENKSSIYCAYTGEILGHKLAKMFKSVSANSKNKIDHSILFSISNRRNISGAVAVAETAKTPEDEALKKEIDAWKTSTKDNSTTYETFAKLFRRVEHDSTMNNLMKKSGYTTLNKLMKIIKEKKENTIVPGFYLFLKDNDDANYSDAKTEAAAAAVINNKRMPKSIFIDIVNKLLELPDFNAYLLLHGGSRHRNKTRHNRKPHKKTRKNRI